MTVLIINMSKVVIVNHKKSSLVVKGSSNKEISELIIKITHSGFSAYMVKQLDEVVPAPEYTEGIDSGVWDNGKKLL